MMLAAAVASLRRLGPRRRRRSRCPVLSLGVTCTLQFGAAKIKPPDIRTFEVVQHMALKRGFLSVDCVVIGGCAGGWRPRCQWSSHE
eukprot:2857991-Rhodomonas_salina.2